MKLEENSRCSARIRYKPHGQRSSKSSGCNIATLFRGHYILMEPTDAITMPTTAQNIYAQQFWVKGLIKLTPDPPKFVRTKCPLTDFSSSANQGRRANGLSIR